MPTRSKNAVRLQPRKESRLQFLSFAVPRSVSVLRVSETMFIKDGTQELKILQKNDFTMRSDVGHAPSDKMQGPTGGNSMADRVQVPGTPSPPPAQQGQELGTPWAQGRGTTKLW